MEVIKKVSYFIIMGLFLIFSNTPLSLAYSMIVCNILAMLVNSFPNRRLIGYTYDLQLLDILPNLIPSVIMLIVVMLLGELTILNKLYLLVIQIFLGVLVFIVACFITRNKNFYYLLNIVKEMIGLKA